MEGQQSVVADVSMPLAGALLRCQIPKYAFVAKEFLEPERIIQFRVSWLDDAGTYRMNRGFRVQVRDFP